MVIGIGERNIIFHGKSRRLSEWSFKQHFISSEISFFMENENKILPLLQSQFLFVWSLETFSMIKNVFLPPGQNLLSAKIIKMLSS